MSLQTSASTRSCTRTSTPSTFSPTTNFYESSCGSCGEQIYFREALTDWVKVLCPGCRQYISVR